ncbi:head GIN domain-containing protein [Hymenobacter jejuensis]|uniref:DUF2807 domain-containing protein n=1 Tax=Hymenobacter jejuensis TaxID=2502781 RepID=A0A5B7ZZP6_9BACT|nr:head GIN domain-containing protein [Hymenobacter jejuensis]QDA59855.1 DUF2807 domain-containing protein [Hymenobacter jejuensis]
MKTLSRLFLLLLPALLLLPGWALASTREVRQVASFTEIGFATSGNVVLRQGSPQKVEVEGEPADLAQLETVVNGNKLRIRTRDNWHGNLGKITVYITVPTINALSVSGSGMMKAATSIKASTLNLSVSGSGRLELPTLQASRLSSSLSGSGSITLAGACPTHEISISGSGDVNATDLKSDVATVSISGSGDCKISASKTLKASIIGSGDVYVNGNPQISTSIIGSGKVHRS